MQVWQVKKFKVLGNKKVVNWQRVNSMFERKIGCEFEKLARLTYLRRRKIAQIGK